MKIFCLLTVAVVSGLYTCIFIKSYTEITGSFLYAFFTKIKDIGQMNVNKLTQDYHRTYSRRLSREGLDCDRRCQKLKVTNQRLYITWVREEQVRYLQKCTGLRNRVSFGNDYRTENQCKLSTVKVKKILHFFIFLPFPG